MRKQYYKKDELVFIPLGKARDLTNQKFYHLTILGRGPNNNSGVTRWYAECDCKEHNIILARGIDIINGHTQSCGCYAKQRVSETTFRNEEGKIYNNIEIIKFLYSNNSYKSIYECICPFCNSLFSAKINDIKTGRVTSCGCNRSLGESTIVKLLTENNISFIREYQFIDFIYDDTNRHPRFDFYVNNEYLIEFDGKQHFEATGGRYTKEIFQKIQKKDNIKNTYCMQKQIPLIRIPYYKLNTLTIEDLLLKSTKYLIT